MMANSVAILTFAVVALVLLSPRLRKSDAWRATVTPLASIIGSGFLVSLPLLVSAVGAWAIGAIALLCALGYLFGAAIRFNIRHGEPLFGLSRFRLIGSAERLSHFSLAFAYFISVTYYLSLLAAFLLKGLGIVEPLAAKAIASVLLISIGGYGLWRGLHGLESIEEFAVSLKLAVIAAVLAALLLLNIELLWTGRWQIGASTAAPTWESGAVVLGLLIVVQGFETSRFLRGEYSPALRIKTMRAAQLLASAIYLAFFALSLVLVDNDTRGADVAAVTTMVMVAAGVLPLMLVAGAVFAQASAAIADAIGAAGLIAENSGGKVRRNHAYPLIALVGVAIVWAVNVFDIIALASRAFALFYLIQCLVALLVAREASGLTQRKLRMALFGLLALAALAVVLLGVPAHGE